MLVNPQIKRLFPAVLLLMLFVAAFIHAWLALTQTPYATGWDAYYYLVQIKAVIEEGSMHSPDYSLFYGLMLLIKFFVTDYLIAYKLTAAFIAGLYVVALFIAGWQLAVSHRNWIAMLCAVFGIFSPSAIFMDVSFTKGFLGIVMLIFFIAALPKARWWLILLLFVATLLAHRLSGAVACLFLLLHYLNKSNWILLLLGLMALLALMAVLPGSLHILDAARFSNEFQHSPQWAFWSFVQFFGWEKISTLWRLELVLSAVLLLLWIVKELFCFRRAHQKSLKLAFFLTFVILLFPFLMFNEEGPALRFFLMYMLLWPLMLVFMADWMNRPLILVMVIAALVAAKTSYRAYDPAKFDPPYDIYEAVTQRVQKEIDERKTGLVIVHKAFAEYFTFTTGIDAMPWGSEEKPDSANILRISYGIDHMDFKQYLDSTEMTSVKRVGISYYLLPEYLWQQFTKRAELSEDSALIELIKSPENPWQLRPAFIMRSRT